MTEYDQDYQGGESYAEGDGYDYEPSPAPVPPEHDEDYYPDAVVEAAEELREQEQEEAEAYQEELLESRTRRMSSWAGACSITNWPF